MPKYLLPKFWLNIHYVLYPWGNGGVGVAPISEHLPVFRTPREGEGRSATVHGRGTLRLSPRKKKYMKMGKDRQTDIWI